MLKLLLDCEDTKKKRDDQIYYGLFQGNSRVDSDFLSHILCHILRLDGLYPTVFLVFIRTRLLHVQLQHTTLYELVNVLLHHISLLGHHLLHLLDDEFLQLLLAHIGRTADSHIPAIHEVHTLHLDALVVDILLLGTPS